jgi:hypothetical protein
MTSVPDINEPTEAEIEAVFQVMVEARHYDLRPIRDTARMALLAARRVSSAPSFADVRIKPLEWHSAEERGSPTKIMAPGLGGSYECRVGVWEGGWIWLRPGSEEYARVEDEDEAKAAAQADYEQRIRSALDIVPAPSFADGIEVAAKWHEAQPFQCVDRHAEYAKAIRALAHNPQASSEYEKYATCNGIGLRLTSQTNVWIARYGRGNTVVPAERSGGAAEGKDPQASSGGDTRQQDIRDALGAMIDWVGAALNCADWHWDGDQRAAAQYEMEKAKSALARANSEATSSGRMKEPCGECHLQPGEACDICGAVSSEPSRQCHADPLRSGATEGNEAGAAAPIPNERRNTFTVPDGYEAVRDAEGRATGEVRPVAPKPDPAIVELSKPDWYSDGFQIKSIPFNDNGLEAAGLYTEATLHRIVEAALTASNDRVAELERERDEALATMTRATEAMVECGNLLADEELKREAAEAEVSRLKAGAVTDWQLIESVPKDGRSIAVWLPATATEQPHAFAPVSICEDGTWWDDSTGGQIEPLAATYWAPIHAPSALSNQAEASE